MMDGLMLELETTLQRERDVHPTLFESMKPRVCFQSLLSFLAECAACRELRLLWWR
jgi:hypothetical protein